MSRFPLTRILAQEGVFRQEPIRVVDVGARGGVEAAWKAYGDQIEIVGFEPDRVESQRLNSRATRMVKYFPLAVYRDKGVRTLYVTKGAECSSFYAPNRSLLERFQGAQRLEVLETAQVETTDLDSFTTSSSIKYVDFLKVDVQGAELDVLEGARSLLSHSVLGVSVEVEFLPLYLGQPLFAQVTSFLQALGFTFFDFTQLERWSRRTLEADFTRRSGQVAWGQALFLRDFPASPKGSTGPEYTTTKLLKLISFSEIFNLPDFSLECLLAGFRTGIISSEQLDRYREVLVESGRSGRFRRRIKEIGVNLWYRWPR